MNWKPYFQFTNSQRKGILLLLSLIVALQFSFYFIENPNFSAPSPENQRWMALQTEIDILKKEQFSDKNKIYPFNPNFITDYKGAKLGMTNQEIDRLLAYRKQNKYVNSAQEFQQITKVSDEWLAKYQAYFKFPDWVTKSPKEFVNYKQSNDKVKTALPVLDLNEATQEDLMKVYGVGEGISSRILKEKEKFGVFMSMDQVDFIWGLSPEVIAELHKCFKIKKIPALEKIKINEASTKELAKFPYFGYALAKEIVTYRSMNGDIKNVTDLTKINRMPLEKVEIIALYLDF